MHLREKAAWSKSSGWIFLKPPFVDLLEATLKMPFGPARQRRKNLFVGASFQALEILMYSSADLIVLPLPICQWPKWPFIRSRTIIDYFRFFN